MDFVSRSDELSNVLVELEKQGNLRSIEKPLSFKSVIKISNEIKKDPENQNLPDIEERMYSFFSLVKQLFSKMIIFFDEKFKQSFYACSSAIELMIVRYLNVANPVHATRVLNYIGKSRNLALEKIKHARSESKFIYDGAVRRLDDVSSNVYLLQSFFLCNRYSIL